MGKKNIIVLCLFLPLILMLISCSNNKVLNLSVNKGDFSKSKSEVITSKYELKSTDGFFSRIDFDLNEGKVDWEIIGPKSQAVFKGYASNENGINNNPDFAYLQFNPGGPLGIYTLSLKPTKAEGKYTVMWSDGMVKK